MKYSKYEKIETRPIFHCKSNFHKSITFNHYAYMCVCVCADLTSLYFTVSSEMYIY